MNLAVNTRGKDVAVLVVLLVVGAVAAALWMVSVARQPAGPSRIEWPASR